MQKTDNRVTVHIADGLRTEISADGYTLVADEPANFGGTDEGPTPYDYLVGALGACTAMTVRMYADRKSWPLKAVTVRLNHQKIHARDCAECETESGRIDHLELDLELEGPLDEGQREKLLNIANMCPVHRTLNSETLIEARLVDQSSQEA